MTSVTLSQGYVEVSSGALGLQIIIGALVVLQLGVFLFALIDAVRRPSSVWRAAGSNKALWIVLIVVFQLLGSIAYLAGVRGRLKTAALP